VSDIPDPVEIFHNRYLWFIGALTQLSRDAVTQCQHGQNFNVAWELQDEFLTGARTVLHYADSGLSDEQRQLLESLTDAVQQLPASAISGSRTSEGSLRDMNNPCWAPLREPASRLLKSLASITDRTNAYFGKSKP